MKPVFTQEPVPNTQGLWSSFASLQDTQGSTETSRAVCTSMTVFGLALSLGASGALFSGVEASEAASFAYLPPASDLPSTLPSYGSDRPSGAAASYHTVSAGETIWDIAKQYGIAVEDIKVANGISDGQPIQAGQVLKVPSSSLAPEPIVEQPSGYASTEVASAEPVAGAVEPDIVESDTAEVTESPNAAPPSLATAESGAPLSLSAFVESRRHTDGLSNERVVSKLSTFDGSVEALTSSSLVPEPLETVAQETSDAVAILPDLATTRGERIRSEGSQELLPTDAGVESSLDKVESSQTVHRITAGETLWSIAYVHGVDPEALRQANRLTNPNVIFPGDTLVVPGNPQVSDAAPSRNSASVTSNRQAVAASPETVPSQIAYEEPTGGEELEPKSLFENGIPILDINTLEAQAAEDVSVVEAPPVEVETLALVEDTEDALPSIAAEAPLPSSVTRTLTVESNPAPIDFAPSVVEGSLEISAAVLDEAIDVDSSTVVEPGDSEADTLNEDELASPPAEELLAAAPLGSEVYAPIVESPEGRVVSPDLPALPPQDEYLPDSPSRFEGYMWPAQGILTSGYGWRWGRMHRGVDIAGPVGTPIFSAAPGLVVRSGWNSGGYGNVVDIRHPDGSLTRYAHNSRLLVEEGQEVQQGQQIAEMGSTGYSTGPHLHFEIHLPDQGAVNPSAYLPGR